MVNAGLAFADDGRAARGHGVAGAARRRAAPAAEFLRLRLRRRVLRRRARRSRAAGIAGAIALTSGGGRAAGLVFGEYVPYLIYLAFGEATLTGMMLTLAVVYRPHWVATFDDARYIVNR